MGQLFLTADTNLTTYLEMECTRREGLPAWLPLMPSVNISAASCHPSSTCLVKYGELPLQSVKEETLSFTPYKSVFGDMLTGYKAGGLSIGDSLIVYCSHLGRIFFKKALK